MTWKPTSPRSKPALENLKHDLKYLSRDLQPFAGSFRLKRQANYLTISCRTMFFYDAARQHKIHKKDGNGSGGSDLISGQLALFEKII